MVPVRARLVCIAALVALAAASAAMEIVTDGRAVATVVIADEPLPVVQFAAEELVYHVKRATGAELAVVAESAMPGLRSPNSRVRATPERRADLTV